MSEHHEHQDDLFPELLDELDKIPSHELKGKWPTILAEFVDVLAHTLGKELKVNDVDALASKLTLSLAHYIGGRAIYLPTGDDLKIALRDELIFRSINKDGNIDRVSREYGLSTSQVYEINRRQRKIYSERHQLKLPF